MLFLASYQILGKSLFPTRFLIPKLEKRKLNTYAHKNALLSEFQIIHTGKPKHTVLSATERTLENHNDTRGESTHHLALSRARGPCSVSELQLTDSLSQEELQGLVSVLYLRGSNAVAASFSVCKLGLTPASGVVSIHSSTELHPSLMKGILRAC